MSTDDATQRGKMAPLLGVVIIDSKADLQT
jgi:hypothetical protein